MSGLNAISLFLQVWLSPWQVSHVLSIVSFVESTLHRVIGPEPGVPPTTPISLAATSTDQAMPTGLAASAMKTQLRLTLSAEIPLISVLCLVSHIVCSHTSAPHLLATQHMLQQKGAPLLHTEALIDSASSASALPGQGRSPHLAQHCMCHVQVILQA